jgi:hypothetical protein
MAAVGDPDVKDKLLKGYNVGGKMRLPRYFAVLGSSPPKACS